jgi:hypothetical protein
MSLLERSEPAPDSDRGAAPRSAYLRILVVAAVAAALWFLMPGVPLDQTVIFALGPHAGRLERLEVSWEATQSEHIGGLTLNFEQAVPERLPRKLRLPNGEYWFRARAQHRNERVERTEVVRRVTLDGSTLTLRLEELTE